MSIAERIKQGLPVRLREPADDVVCLSAFRVETDENGVEWIRAEVDICGDVDTEVWSADGRYHPWNTDPHDFDLVPDEKEGDK